MYSNFLTVQQVWFGGMEKGSHCRSKAHYNYTCKVTQLMVSKAQHEFLPATCQVPNPVVVVEVQEALVTCHVWQYSFVPFYVKG